MYKKLNDLEDNLPLKNQISLFDLKNNAKGEKNMSRFEKALEKLNNDDKGNDIKNTIKNDQKQDNQYNQEIVVATPNTINIKEVANSMLGSNNKCSEYSTITVRIKNTSLEKLDLLKNASGRSRSYIIDNLIEKFIQ